MKKHILTLYLILSLTLTACGVQATTSVAESSTANITMTTTTETTSLSQVTTTQTENTPVSADFDDDDLTSAMINVSTTITLDGDSIAVTGEGATMNGSIVTITAAGVYEITGTLNNGQIVVVTKDAENVTLLLAGVNIHNESSSPIYVANAEKVIITLADGTQNSVSDGENYTNLDENDEPNATIFSHDDLTINGNGALVVTANYNSGIVSKDDLKITGGNITVTAVNDVLTFIPTKEYQSVVLSSASLQNGMAYTLYVGGTASGDMVDGLYTNAIYTPGTSVSSFTIASMVTHSGIAVGGQPGGTPPTRP